MAFIIRAYTTVPYHGEQNDARKLPQDEPLDVSRPGENCGDISDTVFCLTTGRRDHRRARFVRSERAKLSIPPSRVSHPEIVGRVFTRAGRTRRLRSFIPRRLSDIRDKYLVTVRTNRIRV